MSENVQRKTHPVSNMESDGSLDYQEELASLILRSEVSDREFMNEKFRLELENKKLQQAHRIYFADNTYDAVLNAYEHEYGVHLNAKVQAKDDFKRIEKELSLPNFDICKLAENEMSDLENEIKILEYELNMCHINTKKLHAKERLLTRFRTSVMQKKPLLLTLEKNLAKRRQDCTYLSGAIQKLDIEVQSLVKLNEDLSHELELMSRDVINIEQFMLSLTEDETESRNLISLANRLEKSGAPAGNPFLALKIRNELSSLSLIINCWYPKKANNLPRIQELVENVLRRLSEAYLEKERLCDSLHKIIRSSGHLSRPSF